MMLKSYQVEAVDKIASAYNDQSCGVATIYIPSGYGVSGILAESINRILKDDSDAKVLCLVDRREEVFQLKNAIRERAYRLSVCDLVNDYSGQPVLVTTYAAYFFKKREFKFDFIICGRADALGPEKCKQILHEKSRLTLGVFATRYRDGSNPFFNAPCLFKIMSLYHDEMFFQEKFAVPMLGHMGFTDILTGTELFINGAVVRPDIIAVKDGVTYVIEIKTYRGMFNDRQIVQRAIEYITNYKSILERKYQNSRFVAILTCNIDESTKYEIAQQYGIFVWDIKNLLYLCGENIGLLSMLQQITPYPLTGIKSIQPIEADFSVKSKAPSASETNYESQLIEKLKNCKAGKSNKADKEYEKICSEIITYLFKNEFSQFSEQHTTKDDMFRMDIICGLKGTVAFWKFLINYYNTKFVVFECKNYSRKIEQNLIYVTDKYLFNPALRNVAFIISRKGFNDNAQKAALGILKEHGKLILDLTDLDLEIMIKAKSEGKEPSDFLLDKVEKLLMGVSI